MPPHPVPSEAERVAAYFACLRHGQARSHASPHAVDEALDAFCHADRRYNGAKGPYFPWVRAKSRWAVKEEIRAYHRHLELAPKFYAGVCYELAPDWGGQFGPIHFCAMREGFKSLSVFQRAAIIHHVMLGRSYGPLAKRLGRKPATLASDARRGLKVLYQFLKQRPEFDGFFRKGVQWNGGSADSQ